MSNGILKQIRAKKTGSAKAGSSAVGAIPSVADPTLQAWIKSISQEVGAASKKYVRTSELAKAGLIDENGQINIPGTNEDENSTIVPKAVLNLSATGGYSAITLTWDTVNSKFFEKNEVYRAESDDFGKAINIGSTVGNVYTDYIGNSAKGFYWVRSVSKGGVLGELSKSVFAETSIDIDYLIESLQGQVNEGTLSKTLLSKIEVIDDLSEDVIKLNADAKQIKEETKNAINELITDIDANQNKAAQEANAIREKFNGEIFTLNNNLGTEIEKRRQDSILLSNGVNHAQTTADNVTNDLINYKSSVENSFANVQDKIKVATEANTANAEKITQIDSSLKGTDFKAATALQTAQTAVNETQSLASQTQALRANIGAAVLSSIPQSEQPNKFTGLIVPRGTVGAQQIPSYEHLTNATPIAYSYFTQDLLSHSFALDNTIGFFRTIVGVSEARTIVLNDFVGDDAHAIYVDGKLYYSNPYHNGANPSTININLTAGYHILDFAFNNGGGGWGIKFSNSLAGQLNEMYAVTIDYLDKANSSYVNNVKATADIADGKAIAALTQIESLNSTVGNNTAKINNISQTKADKSEVVSISQNGLQSVWQKDTEASIANISVGGRNLFPVSLLSNGYFSGTSGNIITANLAHKSYNQRIPTLSNRYITYQVWNPDLVVNTGYTNRIVFFDANNSLTGFKDIPKLNGSSYQTMTVEIPQNAVSVSLGAIMGVEIASDVAPNIRVKFEFGNKATDWQPAPEDVTNNAITAATTAISALQIGGRNLAKGTGTAITSTSNTGTNRTTTLYYLVQSWLALYNRGYTKLSVSFDWRYVGSTPSGTFRLQQNSSPYASLSNTITLTDTNTSGRISGFLMTPASNWTDLTAIAIRRDNMNGAIEISNFKIEIGTKSTDWTPAPEDIIADLATYKATADQTFQTKTDAAQATASLMQQIATKAEAQDLINTNANITNNYATKSSVNDSLATATQTLTSSFQTADQNILNAASQDAASKANDAISAAAADATNKANNAIATASADATTKANNVKSAAATDATTKANNAKTAAAADATAKANNAIAVAAADATAKANNASSQANAYTQNYAFSKTETSNAITGALQTYDSTVTIGGNNLYRGSKDWSGKWNNIGNYEKLSEKYKELSVLRSYANWSGIQQEQYFDLGVNYTLSAWIRKSAANVPIHFWGDNLAGDAGAGTQKPMEPNIWTRVTHTFKGNGQVGNGRFERVDNGTGGYYDICGLKLERGSKATDWSPNPNDAVDGLVLGGRNLFNRNVVYQEFAGANVVAKYASGFDVWGVGANNAVLRLYNMAFPAGDCVISFDHFIGTAPFNLTFDINDGVEVAFTAQQGWRHYEIVVKNTVDRTDGWLDIGGLTGQPHQFRNFMVEKGNKSSAYKPAPEDTDYAIQQVQANLVNFQQAQASVDQAQTQRLNEAFSQIGNNTSRITNVEQTKADTSQVTSLVRNELSSEWNAAANNAANSAVNALQIGGENLLRNSSFEQEFNHWMYNGNVQNITINKDNSYGAGAAYAYVQTTTGGSGIFAANKLGWVEGQVYTLSGYFRNVTHSLVFGIEDAAEVTGTSQVQAYGLDGIWRKQTVTLRKLGSGGAVIAYLNNAGAFDVRGIKLELGSKATTWAPASEDITSVVNWQIINEPTDLNNLTTTGKYLLKNISANSPVNAWAYVTVDAVQTNRIIQTIWKDNDVNLKLERNKFDATWGEWTQRATKNDVNNLKSEVSQTYQTKSSANETTANLTQSINSKTSPQDVNSLLSAKIDAKDITYRVNLNDMRTVGLYLLRGGWDNGAYSADNQAWHWLDVKGGIVENRVQQTMWPDNSTGTVTNRAWNGTWSDWNTFANTQQVNGLRSEVQNTYSTKTDTTNAIAQGINAYKASLGSVFTYKLEAAGLGQGFAGIRDAVNGVMHQTPRNYGVARFRDGQLISWNGFDLFSQNAQGLVDVINNSEQYDYIAVITWDEPQTGRSDAMRDALVSIGGTRAAFNALQYRGAYILVGRKGLQEGGGMEMISNGAPIAFSLQFINGVPIGVGGNASAAQQVASNASVITQTKAQIGDLENNLNNLAQTTTTLTSTVAKLGSASSNLLKNSDFSSGLDNWSYWSNIGGGTGIRNPPDDWAVVADESRTAEIHVGGNSNTGGYACIGQTVPIVAGKWYQFSGFTGVHRASYHKYVLYWNDLSGNRIGSQQIDATMWAGGKRLSDYYNAYFNAQAPSNAVSATCEVGCGGGSDVYMFMTRFNFCQVANADTTLIPWSPSAFGLAPLLQQNKVTLQQQMQVLDGIKALAAMRIDNNGVFAGWGITSELLKNGQVFSEIGFQADRFFFMAPDGKSYPFILDNGKAVFNSDVYIRNGSIKSAQIGELGADKITSGDIAADRMRANIVEAVQGKFQNLSSLTARIGHLRSADSGRRFEITENGMFCYDENNRLRGFFGSRRQ